MRRNTAELQLLHVELALQLLHHAAGLPHDERQLPQSSPEEGPHERQRMKRRKSVN